MNVQIPRDLVKVIKDNNLVLFAGAGLSYDFVNSDDPPKKLGDWKNLIKEIMECLMSSSLIPCRNADSLNSMIISIPINTSLM